MGNTCIPWQIHFDIWQNQYNIVKLKNKIKFKKKQIVNAGDGVQSLGWEDPPKKEMATRRGTLAWKIPRREEPGGLQSIGSQ